MDTIYKYQLPNQGKVALTIPGGGGDVRMVAAQNGNLCVWLEVDTERTPDERIFHVVGTGQPLDRVAGMAYCGSAVVGDYVWHVFGE